MQSRLQLQQVLFKLRIKTAKYKHSFQAELEDARDDLQRMQLQVRYDAFTQRQPVVKSFIYNRFSVDSDDL